MLETKDFDIAQTLECGQCFRFERLEKGHYQIIANGRLLNVHQLSENETKLYYPGENGEFIPIPTSELKEIWIPYFDLQRDYDKIKTTLKKRDSAISKAIDFAPGIRILNQEPFETIISFIISQNNRIPQIKKVIKNISQKYGKKLINELYAFPTVEELSVATLEELKECRLGFRDVYVIDAVEKIRSGAINLSRDNGMSTAELKASLMQIRGVGEKVAHCILLFGYSRFDAFPVDVWMRRIMEDLYFGGLSVKPSEIQKRAETKFGVYSGFAQQYLFHYSRMNPKPRKK
ncbi:MAG: hypothetical protein FWD01_00515 [Defluviitaleaceae bacterium]|nr:hypothetical protein [Defluviitaleaceae bacterium]